MTDAKEQSEANFTEFDLSRQMAEAEKKKPWPQGRYSETLLKRTDMRILLVLMEKGTELKEHHVDGSISVQMLRGSIRFAAQAESHEVKTGTVVTLGPAIKHRVEAIDDSAFMVTISWPETYRLEEMAHRGYGT